MSDRDQIGRANRDAAHIDMHTVREEYERRVHAIRTRRALTLADAPAEDLENLSEGFRQILAPKSVGK